MDQFPVSLDNLIAFVRAIHPEGDPLAHLGDAMRVSSRLEDQGDALIGHFVDQARRSGASWTQIGERMGVSKQAAQKRFVARADELVPGGAGKMFGRFAPRARNALVAARRIAAGDGPDSPVQPRHVVAGLLTEPEGIAARAVHQLGVSEGQLLDALGLPADAVTRGADTATPVDISSAAVHFDTESKQTLSRTLNVALHFGHNYIGTEHLLLALAAEGSASGPLHSLGLDVDRLRPWITAEVERIAEARKGEQRPPAQA
ncbi:Clp protease N-terminal domain-containing protein [Phaeacidiphilus oryzae]|uniref:Clp protease N-terminal domain-containing protein n=1 Tax=Phaeacidiphilus oryzae TaxID=348818 RepID=UPI0005671A1E|nr:Clp protease N-terminal domain-containing protein [Phaeacidiphilus oryzae]